jgi:hypothetical protein
MSNKRERPMVTGKDAERFMEMVRKNNEYIKQKRESRNKKEELIMTNKITLTQIADMLWREMLNEVERNGHSDHTLALEGAVYDIREIVELNNNL